MPTDREQTTAPTRLALRAAAQMARDQQSDDPAPGTWNDACEHIAKLLLGAADAPE